MPFPLQTTRWDSSEADNVDIQYKQINKPQKPSWLNGYKGILIRILVILVFFSLGLVIGYLIRRHVSDVMKKPYVKDYSIVDGKTLQAFITAESLSETLKNLTKEVHLAGRHMNNILGNDLAEMWVNYGLDHVHKKTYNVLLSYPDIEKPNSILVVDKDGKIVLKCNTTGTLLHPELLPYNAYAAAGSVQGKLVYANYGRKQDFDLLVQKNINVTGNIVIMKYGFGFRGDKVQEATKRGAVGALLFTDPAPFAADPSKVWPNGWYIPGDAVQLGTVRHDGGGDPMTPDNPSIEGAYRVPLSKLDLPVIPVQPIGYNDAERLMRYLAGEKFNDWTGLLHIDYRTGPGFQSPKQDWTVKLDVYNDRSQEDISNIIGIIRGIEEPDRYVIVGNHRDAWSYGAHDPAGGTAILNELVKAFGELKKTGWQPRRTIIFANWDAEEFGLIGSFEWMEEFSNELSQRTVAYINMDAPIKGNYSFSARSSPMLHDVLYNATRRVKVRDPKCSHSTVYDDWAQKKPDIKVKNKPRIDYLGAGSDHTSFLHEFGIPSMYPAYRYPSHISLPSLPFYHTDLDTYQMVSKYVDPNFYAHSTYAAVVAEIILELADARKLPLDVASYVISLRDAYHKCVEKHMQTLQDKDISLRFLHEAVSNFERAANHFESHATKVDPNKEADVRRLNDQLIQLTRVFITPKGLPGRPQIRNVLLAPADSDWYSGSTFPGIEDGIALAKENGDWETVKEQVSILTLAINSGTNVLKGGIVGL